MPQNTPKSQEMLLISDVGLLGLHCGAGQSVPVPAFATQVRMQNLEAHCLLSQLICEADVSLGELFMLKITIQSKQSLSFVPFKKMKAGNQINEYVS